MTTVTVFTAERMAEIEAQAVIGAEVVGDDLIMTRFNETTFNAGNVRGAPGDSTSQHTPLYIVVASAGADSSVIDTADFVCDGTNDEVELMLAIDAIQAAGSGELILSDGNFYLDLTETGSIYFSDMFVRGGAKDRTTLNVMNPTGSCVIFDQTVAMDLTIKDVTGTDVTYPLVSFEQDCLAQRVIVETSFCEIGVRVEDYSTIIRDCNFSIGTGVNVFADGGGIFENCNFTAGLDSENLRIYADNGVDRFPVRVINCHFSDGPSGENDYHIRFWGNSTDADAEANCLIDGCTFRCPSTGVAIAGTMSDNTPLQIVNCNFQENNRTKKAIDLDGAANVQILDNQFNGCGTAIELSNLTSAKIFGNTFIYCIVFVVATNSDYSSVQGNTFLSKDTADNFSGPGSLTGQKAIQFTDSDEVFIVANQFLGIATDVVTLTTCNHSVVCQNLFFRCGRHTDNTYSGIKLVTTDDASILNNKVSAAADTVKLKYCLEILAGCDRTYVHGNHFYNAADTAAILDSGTSTDTTSDNKTT